MPKPDLTKFVVLSCDIDTCEIFVDFIEARDEDTARKIVMQLRPNANHCDAFGAKGLQEELTDFVRCEGSDWKVDLLSLKKHWQDHEGPKAYLPSLKVD